MSVQDQAELITVDRLGHRFKASRRTVAHLDYTIWRFKRLYPKARLVIYQTPYNTGVKASEGTHDRDAVFDFGFTGVMPGPTWYRRWRRFERFLRNCGWGCWFRHTGHWAPRRRWHVHGFTLPVGLKVFISPVGHYVDGGRSTSGRVWCSSQLADYTARPMRNGMKGHAKDDGYQPPNIAATTFDYRRWTEPKGTPAVEHHFKVVTCNALKSLRPAAVNTLLDKVLDQADVVLWQELTPTHRREIRKRKGWAHYFPPEGPWGVGISWRRSRFSLTRRGRFRNTVRGISKDPARGLVDVVLRDRRTGRKWPFISAHMTHQAWTSHPERRPRWWTQALRLRWRTRTLERRWGRAVGGADSNRSHWHPKGTSGVWGATGTYASHRYDVIWKRGSVQWLGAPRNIKTPSDHDALLIRIG